MERYLTWFPKKEGLNPFNEDLLGHISYLESFLYSIASFNLGYCIGKGLTPLIQNQDFFNLELTYISLGLFPVVLGGVTALKDELRRERINSCWNCFDSHKTLEESIDE